MTNDHQPKISIIMPIYNGGHYLRRTLDSILEQTFPDYEALCINDCSTDNSLAILEEYGAKDPRFRVLSTDANKGIVPKVINFAIPYVRGDYFVYTSQDDLFSRDWLQSMYDKAVSTGADAVIPDLVFYYENEPQRNRALSGIFGDKNRVLTNREAVAHSLDWKIPGNALWRVRLLNEIGFYDFGMHADEYTVRVYFFNCNKIVFSGGMFYYRQDNKDAITKKVSEKAFDVPYTEFRLFLFLRDHDFSGDIQNAILLKSIVEMARMKRFLNTCRVRRLFSSSSNSSLSIDAAEQWIRRCFDELQSDDVLACLSSTGGARARFAKIMLKNYTLFTAMSFLGSIAHWVRAAVRAIAPRKRPRPYLHSAV